MKKILLTGANGFLGKEIYKVISQIGIVHTIGRKLGDYVVDLSKETLPLQAEYDVIIHCAGMAHTFKKDKVYEKKMYAVNDLGTQNLLKSFNELGVYPKSFIFISSVAVYGRTEGVDISESEFLAATDAYGKSKINAENAILAWGKINNVAVIILRLPLVVGENPPGNLGNMITGIQKKRYFSIGKGNARKSMVLAKDVAALVSQDSLSEGVYNLTDGIHPTFSELEEVLKRKYSIKYIPHIPYVIARGLAFIGDLINIVWKGKFPFDSKVLNKISSTLTFSDSKAREVLGWNPRDVLNYYKK